MALPAAASSDLLPAALAARLERMDVASRKILHGTQQGEKRAKKKGASVEFAEHRAYVAGDDLRRMDWNLFARTDRLYLRLFLEDQDLTVTLVVDHSASMAYGEPEKLAYARRLAAALGYLALCKNNRLSVVGIGAGSLSRSSGLRGRLATGRLLHQLRAMQPTPGRADLVPALRRVGADPHSNGVVFVLSDFWESADLVPALRGLAGPKRDVVLIHLLSPQERDPRRGGIDGDLRLTDVETAEAREMSIHARALERYRQNVAAHADKLRLSAQAQGIGFLSLDTDVPVEEAVFGLLREAGYLA